MQIEVQCNPYCGPGNWPHNSPWPVISGSPTTSVLEQLEKIGIQPIKLLDGTHKLLSLDASFAAVPSQEIICITRPLVFFLGTVAPDSAYRSPGTDTLSETMLQSRSELLAVLTQAQLDGKIWLVQVPFTTEQNSIVGNQFHTVKYFELWMTNFRGICAAAKPSFAELIALHTGHGHVTTGAWMLKDEQGRVQNFSCQEVLNTLLPVDMEPDACLPVTLLNEACRGGVWIQPIKDHVRHLSAQVQFRYISATSFGADGQPQDSDGKLVTMRFWDPEDWKMRIKALQLNPVCLHSNFSYQSILKWEPFQDVSQGRI